MNPSVRPDTRAFAKAESVFFAGESGAAWRVLLGFIRLDRDSGATRHPVQLALPGDLIGIESLCERCYQFSATAFTACLLQRVSQDIDGQRVPLLQQALLQHQDRSEGMTALRTGSVPRRITHWLCLMGLVWRPDRRAVNGEAYVIRDALPTLREMAQVVDAKTETVCRALAQLLPPRSRKPGPVRAVRDWSSAAPGFLAKAWGANPAPLAAAV
jgi:hypothetical protein